jgi:hypothetical protein
MLDAHPYYWLLASLPALPPPWRVTRLPLNAARLDLRLRAVPREDRVLVDALRDLLQVLRSACASDDAEILARADSLGAHRRPAGLAALIAALLEPRTLLSALRRQRMGEAAPPAASAWGPPALTARLARDWRHLDDRVGHIVPWLRSAREELAAPATLPALGRRLDALTWRALDVVGAGHRFDLTALLVYLCRWDLLERVLTRDAVRAAARFAALVDGLAGPAEVADQPTP